MPHLSPAGQALPDPDRFLLRPTHFLDRTVPFVLLVFLLCGLAPAGAQTPPSGTQTGTQTPTPAGQQTPEVSAKQAQEIKDELDEISILRYLNVLQLTPIQMDQLINAVTFETSAYQTKLNTLGATPFLKMLDEIHTVHQQALKGGDIPKEFMDRVKKIEDDFIAKREQLYAQYIKNLTAAYRRILKPEQITAVVSLLRENAGQEIKGTDDQFLNAFSVQVLLGNARAMPVLKEMRAAAKTSDASGEGSSAAH